MNNQMLKPSEKQILAAVIFVSVITVTYLFAIKPMNEKRAQIEKQTTEINNAGELALSKIRNMQNMRLEYAAISNDLFAVTNRYVVRPVLGSYPMEQDIYKFAEEAQFKVTGCLEIGRTLTPTEPPQVTPATSGKPKTAKKKAPPKALHFDRFQMEVSGSGSYYSVIKLIHALEEQNPFFSVTSIDITANKRTPEVHNVVMKLEWPIDAKPLPVQKKK